MPLILGIESTCDETAAAVVADGRRVLSSVVASQVDLHARYRGVVPEIASRAHIENILPVIHDAIDQAGISLDQIDAVSVTNRPGLIGSLLIGLTAAKTLAWILGKPLIGVDHVHAHLYSVALERSESAEQGSGGDQIRVETQQLTASDAFGNSLLFPAVGLVISGGHTALYALDDWLDVRLLGSTIDDAVGEAYDKVSAVLGLGYPGGPVIDARADRGDPQAIRFPRTLLGRDSLDFSFSGLKTAVLYSVRGVPTRPGRRPAAAPPPLDEQRLADVAASFQAACIDVLITKLQRAARKLRARSILIGGGVSANRGLRQAVSKLRLPAYMPPLRYCTDNAAMSAGLADLHYRAGHFDALSLDAITSSRIARVDCGT